MKKKPLFSLIVTNVAIILVIMAGFAWAIYQDSTSYYQLIKEQLVSVVRLASMNIYTEIDDDLTKPLMVSRTMANDTFLIEWALDESSQGATEEQLSRLTAYLNEYHKEYDYNTIFFVSEKSKHYYYQEGVHKVISPQDDHDQWYYMFLESGKTMNMELDTDESEGDNLAIFMNYRVEDENGNLLGVIGVGYDVSGVIAQMEKYQEAYDLKIYLIGNENTVKTTSQGNSEFVTEDEFYSRIHSDSKVQLSKDSDFDIYWDVSQYNNDCIVVKYLDNLDWYLVLEKNMESVKAMFLHNMYKNISSIVIVVVLCSLLTTGIFLFYRRELIKHENTDDLTGLMNRKHFEARAKKLLKKGGAKTLFLFDIDAFKMVNDERGHAFGDKSLALVGTILQAQMKSTGIVARWGGDEFCGVLEVDTQKAKELIEKFMAGIAGEETNLGCLLTVSCGLVAADKDNSLEQLFQMADTSLYCAKKNGGNQVTEYK